MKAKILTIMISFIFLFTFFSNTLYAVTNEIETNDEIFIDSEENLLEDEDNFQNIEEVYSNIDKDTRDRKY